MAIIDINNFVKSYGDIQAVKGISLKINEGELFGIIGPDGAGKTTLLRTICTLLVPDQGTIKVENMNVMLESDSIRSILGYMPQRFSLYQDLTVAQNLRFFADLFQVEQNEQEKRIADLYNFSRLEPFKNRRAGALSGGMKQKLALSCALIHTPKILILDEPTFGVDPVSRKEFWDILHSIRDSGTTIVVSTAYMDEANLCERVALFFNGKITLTNKPDKLRESFKYPLFQIRGNNLVSLNTLFKGEDEIHNIQKFGDTLHISFYDSPDKAKWERWQKQSEGNLIEWELIEPSIEDIFLNQMENMDG
jgi:ABC-type multidrug transport system ATPase subunit